MRIWAMQSSYYRCLQSILAALNGAQSSVCCHCSGTQLSHPSVQQWQLTTHSLPDVVNICYILVWQWSFTLSSVMMGESRSGLRPEGSICAPVVNCIWLNGFSVNMWWRHNRMRAASLTVTPLSPLSPGGCTHFHTYHVLWVCDGDTWGKRYAGANYRIKMSPFCEGKSQEEKWRGLYGRIPLNQPLSWLSWHWGAKCHANSSVSPEEEQVPSPSAAALFCQLRITCRLRQMPQLINALPLTQQLSNKQDISVGLLSVFCVTQREAEREGAS